MYGHLHRPETQAIAVWPSNSSSHSPPNEASGNPGLQYASLGHTLWASYIKQYTMPCDKVTYA